MFAQKLTEYVKLAVARYVCLMCWGKLHICTEPHLHGGRV